MSNQSDPSDNPVTPVAAYLDEVEAHKHLATLNNKLKLYREQVHSLSADNKEILNKYGLSDLERGPGGQIHVQTGSFTVMSAPLVATEEQFNLLKGLLCLSK